jgi:tetratricopeptide (TPR) repeat protein
VPAVAAAPASDPQSLRGVSRVAGPGGTAADVPGLEGLDPLLLGSVLAPEAGHALEQASRAYPDYAAAERHLLHACELAPDHPSTLIGLYRFYFYSNRLDRALTVGLRCLKIAARENRLPLDWRLVRPQFAAFDTYLALPRFYLFSLKACCYLRLRLGDLAGGVAMLDKLTDLDPKDRVQGCVLRGVVDRLGRDDEEYS